MTIVSKATLKTYFVRGAKPTEAQFTNLIDSLQGYSVILNQIDAKTSAGFRGFIDVQSGSSAEMTPYGTVGLQVLQAQTATSAKQILAIGAAVSAEFATTAQAVAGAAEGISMSPVLTRNAIQAFAITSANFSTTAQAIAGTDNTSVVTPVLVKNAIQSNTYNSIGVGTSVYTSAATAIPTATTTLITFDQELYDDFGWHNNVTNPSRITVDYNGKLLINAKLGFNNTSNARFTALLYKNGVEFARADYSLLSGSPPTVDISDVITVSANDYVELYGYQTTGVTVNTLSTTTKMVATRIK